MWLVGNGSGWRRVYLRQIQPKTPSAVSGARTRALCNPISFLSFCADAPHMYPVS